MRIKFQLNRTDAKETGIYARFFINKKPIKIYLATRPTGITMRKNFAE